MCGQQFQTPTNYLSAAVDVYADWVEACEAVAVEAAKQEADERKKDREFSSYATEQARARAGGDDEDDDYE